VLLDKEELSKREKAELKDYDSGLAELKADKVKWFELLQKAQGIV
jgi:hypothetical protein